MTHPDFKPIDYQTDQYNLRRYAECDLLELKSKIGSEPFEKLNPLQTLTFGIPKLKYGTILIGLMIRVDERREIFIRNQINGLVEVRYVKDDRGRYPEPVVGGYYDVDPHRVGELLDPDFVESIFDTEKNL